MVNITDGFKETLNMIQVKLSKTNEVSALQLELSETDEKISEILNRTKDQAQSLCLLGLQKKVRVLQKEADRKGICENPNIHLGGVETGNYKRNISEAVFLIPNNEGLHDKVDHVSREFLKITELPEEIIVDIFLNLDTQGLGRIAQVSKQLNRIGSDNAVWVNKYNKAVLKCDQNSEVVCYKDAVRRVQAVVRLAQLHADCLMPDVGTADDSRKKNLFSPYVIDVLKNPSISLGEKNKVIKEYLNSPSNRYGQSILGELSSNHPAVTSYLLELLLELGARPDYYAYYCKHNREYFTGTLEQIHAALQKKNVDPITVKMRRRSSPIDSPTLIAPSFGPTVRNRILAQHGAVFPNDMKRKGEEEVEKEIKKIKTMHFFKDNKNVLNKLDEMQSTSMEQETFFGLVEKFSNAFPFLKELINKNICSEEKRYLYVGSDKRWFSRSMKWVLSEYALSAISDADERLIHFYNEKNSIFDYKNSYRVPSLNGSETDREMLVILYAMPWKMRKEVLALVRQQPEILPLLTAPNPLERGSPAFECASRILSEATKKYLLKLAEQKDVVMAEEASVSNNGI